MPPIAPLSSAYLASIDTTIAFIIIINERFLLRCQHGGDCISISLSIFHFSMVARAIGLQPLTAPIAFNARANRCRVPLSSPVGPHKASIQWAPARSILLPRRSSTGATVRHITVICLFGATLRFALKRRLDFRKPAGSCRLNLTGGSQFGCKW